MENRVILILIDGMRPDGVRQCGGTFFRDLTARGSYSLTARSVFPSMTLPCHMSLFHSVPPERHGTTTNTYMPPVRPISGLFEQIRRAGGSPAIFYNWDELRDVARPSSVVRAEFVQYDLEEHTDRILTEHALAYIREKEPEFLFLYLGELDAAGHKYGWMSEEYLSYLTAALGHVQTILEEAGDRYTVIVTADHGGHGRTHGTELPEDMTIPMFFFGSRFAPGECFDGVGLLDLAPTIADILGVPAAPEWEGNVIGRDR